MATASTETTGNGERRVSVVLSLSVLENKVCTSHVENGAENGSRINETSQTTHSLDSIDDVLNSKTGANQPRSRNSTRHRKRAGFADNGFTSIGANNSYVGNERQALPLCSSLGRFVVRRDGAFLHTRGDEWLASGVSDDTSVRSPRTPTILQL
ncbi:MAG: hypothetical protein ABJA98_30330 [Acidobacteriota bacterium]